MRNSLFFLVLVYPLLLLALFPFANASSDASHPPPHQPPLLSSILRERNDYVDTPTVVVESRNDKPSEDRNGENSSNKSTDNKSPSPFGLSQWLTRQGRPRAAAASEKQNETNQPVTSASESNRRPSDQRRRPFGLFSKTSSSKRAKDVDAQDSSESNRRDSKRQPSAEGARDDSDQASATENKTIVEKWPSKSTWREKRKPKIDDQSSVHGKESDKEKDTTESQKSKRRLELRKLREDRKQKKEAKSKQNDKESPEPVKTGATQQESSLTGQEQSNATTTAKQHSNATSSTGSTNATFPDSQRASGQVPTMVYMGTAPIMSGPPPVVYRGQPSQLAPPRGMGPMPPPTTGLLIAEVAAALLSNAMRIWFLTWITKRIALQEESMHPTQHFVWECVNDRFIRDEKALTNALSRPPSGVSLRAWRKHLRKLRPKAKIETSLPTRTVVVVDITPNNELDLAYMAEVITFLISQHAKRVFGNSLEVVMLLHSPGGGVPLFGLAASQIARLKEVGIDSTICVDKVAASGGYMMASQASKILAAPFAAVGSIGVMLETLNLNKVLNNYGIRPLVLKAGDSKNPLTTYGEVTPTDLKHQQDQLEKVHRAFVDLCLSNRPALNESVCDGTVLMGAEALKAGMIDGIQTSDEYLWEKIREGDLVLMLHKAHSSRERRKLLSALDLLPHLRRFPKEKIGPILLQVVQVTSLLGLAIQHLRRGLN